LFRCIGTRRVTVQVIAKDGSAVDVRLRGGLYNAPLLDPPISTTIYPIRAAISQGADWTGIDDVAAKFAKCSVLVNAPVYRRGHLR
jgi:hypothetical protein